MRNGTGGAAIGFRKDLKANRMNFSGEFVLGEWQEKARWNDGSQTFFKFLPDSDKNHQELGVAFSNIPNTSNISGSARLFCWRISPATMFD